MKKILINIPSQFGYHTDTYMYCKYLDKTKYEIHYVGFDTALTKRGLENDLVRVHYIPVHSNKIKRYWLYLISINKLIRGENFDVVFQVDHKLTLLVRLCNLNRKFILDIRTGDLSQSNLKRFYLNLFVSFTSLFYRRVSVISDSLRLLLNISTRKTRIIPLGADKRNCRVKSWNSLNLFYIGTIHLRNINQTIKGLALFLREFPLVLVSYDIVGMGTDADVLKLKQAIVESNLEKIVTFHGQKGHDEIKEIWEKANVGVVYVPITPYYNCQPSTKLYECLLAGMPVIATDTFENRSEIGDSEGVLILDNPESFALGLETIYKNQHLYNSSKLKEKFIGSTWENIVKLKLEPLFEEVLLY